MKILLIAPARKPEWGESFWDLEALCCLTGAKTSGAPLSILTLASLCPSKFDVRICDENIEQIDFQESADIVGITAFTSHAPRAYEIADNFRKNGCTVVLGGIHASMVPDESLQHCDSVVIGEAEEVWPKLLNDFAQGKTKKIYRQQEFPDLSNSPIPRWDLINEKDYLAFGVQTSRGCPYNCNFCSVSLFNGQKIRHKPVESVLKEVQWLKEINPKKTIFFTDDNLLADEIYANRLFEGLRYLNIRWWCQASINKLDNDNLLKSMYGAGCRQVFVGFESLSEESLQYLNKNGVNKLQDYKRVIEEVYKNGIAICGSFILGTDGESEEIFDKTHQFISATKLPYAMINLVTPLPGTTLFKELEEADRIVNCSWHKFNGESVCFKPSLISEDELRSNRNNLLGLIYKHNAIKERLRYLWKKGVLVRKGGRYATKGRVLATLGAFRLHPRQWFFIINNLWNSSNVSVMSVLMAASCNEYARASLTPKRENVDLKIRQAQITDVNSIAKLEESVWGSRAATAEMIKSRISSFQDGVLIAEVDGSIVGVVFFQLIDSNKIQHVNWYQYTDNGMIKRTHCNNGDTIFGVGLSVSPDHRNQGIAAKLMIEVAKSAIRLNVKKGLMGARIPLYHKYKDQSVEQYINLKREDGLLVDPELRLYQRMGLRIEGVVPNYFNDPESNNYGVILSWNNPLHKYIDNYKLPRCVLTNLVGLFYKLRLG